MGPCHETAGLLLAAGLAAAFAGLVAALLGALRGPSGGAQSAGLLLTALAGYVDGLGFTWLGGLYPSFMSGNTTQLGVALGQASLGQVSLGQVSLGQASFGQALMPAGLIGLFLAGATLGTLLSIVAPSRWRTGVVLAFEALLLLGALAIGLATPALDLSALLMALAMGAQNAAIAAVQGFRGGTTFVTGTLFSLGQGLARALTGTGPALGWWREAAAWLALVSGAVAGAAAYATVTVHALIVPAACVSAVAVAAGASAILGPAGPRP
ncbi:YoaK family protein [Methylobacterium sp. ID0610]|uniref:YoaK family protein n=1 Tax=Methylobacterium carpenticola TaxID=3344827 RepID=UPI0036CDD980